MATQSSSSVQEFHGTYRWFGDTTKAYTLSYVDTFEQASTGHPKYTYRGNGDGGAGWFMEKTQHQINPAGVDNFWMSGPVLWGGPINTLIPADLPPQSPSDIRGMGATAISRSAPTVPSFGLAQFLGELREGAPKIIGSGLLKEKTRFLKKRTTKVTSTTGSEYLNVEFGWKPIVNDVQNFARAVIHSDKVISAYVAGSDTKIRRRHAFDPVHKSWSVSGGGPCVPTEPIVMASAQGTVTLTGTSKCWFSGAFKYHVPMGTGAVDKLKGHVSKANHLLGVKLTPDVMWNLAPWSWATDWFANTGDIMTNISALGTDGLAMQYGYMMNSVENIQVNSFTVDGPGGGSGSFIRNHTVKIRTGASPFGFDLDFDGLSTRQQAIAAAIGVSRR